MAPRSICQRSRHVIGSLLLLIVASVGQAVAQEPPQVTEGSVEPTLDGAQDAAIEGRLRATFEALDGFEEIRLDVEAGVVRLSGEVDSTRTLELAASLAEQVGGVVAIDNQIEQSRAVARRLRIASDRLLDRTYRLIDQLPLAIVALTVFLLVTLVGRLLARWDWAYLRVAENVFVRNLARQATRLVFLVIGALAALEIMDATALVGALVGAAGVLGLALSFAFRDLIENYIASVLLSLRRPFAPGDHVKIEGYEGRVGRLTSRATILITFDGNHIRVPNAVVFKSIIENFTRKPERRFSFAVGAGVEEDLVAARELGIRILEEMKGVLDEPGPSCSIEELGDSSITLKFYGWVDQHEVDFVKVRSEAIRLIKRAFDEAEIEMPEPIQRMRVESIDAAQHDASDRSREKATPKSTFASGQHGSEAHDIEIDRHVEALVEAERAGAEDDLLSDEAPVE